jgi:hypothetical protein
MMQAAHSRHRNNSCASILEFGLPPAGSLIRRAEVSPVVVVVTDILGHEAFEMALVEYDHMVKQVSAAIAGEALSDAVLRGALKN